MILGSLRGTSVFMSCFWLKLGLRVICNNAATLYSSHMDCILIRGNVSGVITHSTTKKKCMSRIWSFWILITFSHFVRWKMPTMLAKIHQKLLSVLCLTFVICYLGCSVLFYPHSTLAYLSVPPKFKKTYISIFKYITTHLYMLMIHKKDTNSIQFLQE